MCRSVRRSYACQALESMHLVLLSARSFYPIKAIQSRSTAAPNFPGFVSSRIPGYLLSYSRTPLLLPGKYSSRTVTILNSRTVLRPNVEHTPLLVSDQAGWPNWPSKCLGCQHTTTTGNCVLASVTQWPTIHWEYILCCLDVRCVRCV